VQPVELVAVDRAVAQVDREEVGRGLPLPLQDEPLLADVAVDHAQDRGDAVLAAGRQRELRPDVAEDQRRVGPPPGQRAGQDPVEVPRPPAADGAPRPRMARAQAILGRQGQVDAPGGEDPVPRDLRVMAPPQDALQAAEAPGGEPRASVASGPSA
jgi:hypothetical protein